MNKSCDRCKTRGRRDGTRFCIKCREDVLREMARDKYLTPQSSGRWDRPRGYREAILETKFGVD